MICCIDSNIFIWGIKGKADEGQEHMISKAEYLFDWVDANGHQIMIPTVVLAEVLAPEPLEKYPVIMDKISKGIIIADFDIKAASRYGQIFMNRIDEVKKLADENKIDNQKMKIDHLIIATALSNNAGCIFSTDNGLKAFGQKIIEIRDLPNPPAKAVTLFGNLNY